MNKRCSIGFIIVLCSSDSTGMYDVREREDQIVYLRTYDCVRCLYGYLPIPSTMTTSFSASPAHSAGSRRRASRGALCKGHAGIVSRSRLHAGCRGRQKGAASYHFGGLQWTILTRPWHVFQIWVDQTSSRSRRVRFVGPKFALANGAATWRRV